VHNIRKYYFVLFFYIHTRGFENIIKYVYFSFFNCVFQQDRQELLITNVEGTHRHCKNITTTVLYTKLQQIRKRSCNS